MKYILLWSIKGYSECGGGTYYNYIEDKDTLIKEVNKLNDDNNLDFFKCYELGKEITFEEVSKITEWKIKS